MQAVNQISLAVIDALWGEDDANMTRGSGKNLRNNLAVNQWASLILVGVIRLRRPLIPQRYWG